MPNELIPAELVAEHFIKTARNMVKQEFPDLTDQEQIDKIALQIIIEGTKGLREGPMRR